MAVGSRLIDRDDVNDSSLSLWDHRRCWRCRLDSDHSRLKWIKQGSLICGGAEAGGEATAVFIRSHFDILPHCSFTSSPHLRVERKLSGDGCASSHAAVHINMQMNVNSPASCCHKLSRVSFHSTENYKSSVMSLFRGSTAHFWRPPSQWHHNTAYLQLWIQSQGILTALTAPWLQ